MTNFEKVGEFMKTFGQEIKLKASLGSDKINDLRVSLIEEELNELKQAMKQKNLGHAFGVNLDKCFDEVQNSNMSKLGNDGKPIYNDKGKVMKGPNYFKPDLSKFLL